MKRTQVLTIVLLALFVVVAACKKEAEAPKVEEGPAPAATTAAIDPATAATVTGKVVFKGTPPRRNRIRMDAEPNCVAIHKQPIYGEEVVVNDNNTLRYVFIYVKEGLGDRSFPSPAQPAVLDQKGCMYIPHVAGVMVNQELHVLNSDPTTHNIHPVPVNNREKNVSMPPGAEKLVFTFPREEVLIPVKCNVHPWMKSYIGVLRHPFFAVTGADGSFTIKGLPPGEYVIEAWHEKYGATEQKLTLATKETKTIEFTFTGAGGD